ncbi:MAG: hypothetical protein JW969_13345 [Spirochaetales bacterium]|nr:hypothetical protein [Spirochaetales bacterium]
MSIQNSFPKGFLKKYNFSDKKEIKFIQLSTGFLKLDYHTDNDIAFLGIVSFVLKDKEDSFALGNRLKFIFSSIGNSYETVTFISENGVSGTQWHNGKVIWGHTYDDDSQPSKGCEISLDDWIDECIDIMINPDDELVDEYKRIE